MLGDLVEIFVCYNGTIQVFKTLSLFLLLLLLVLLLTLFARRAVCL